MNKEKSPLSEKARCNRTVIVCHWGEAIIISLAYFMEIIKGQRSIPYVLMVILLALLPVIIEEIIYKKDSESPSIKHIVGIGYSLVYMLVMYTTNNGLTFVYVIPMLIAISVFDDFLYSILINSGYFLINIIEVVIMLKRGLYTSVNSAEIEIQLFVMLVAGAYSIYTSRALGHNNKNKIIHIEEQTQKTENVLNNTMNIADQMVTGIQDIDSRSASLSEALKLTQEAMSEVNTGSNDTAEAVQNQLSQTEEIQQKVDEVGEGTNAIVNSMNDTKKAIADGNQNIRLLLTQVEESVNSGSQVTDELNSLSEDMKKMNSIVDIINEITSQTSLLALNASIEAARAGEAGKGFAVVASEISQMANQTEEATVKITGLIENVSEAINRVITVSENMIGMIKSQNETTTLTAKSFEVIDNNSLEVSKHATELADAVSKLKAANRGIVDSISTISAISEEVAAHASDTYSSSEKNNSTIEEVISILSNLKVLTAKLKNNEVNN